MHGPDTKLTYADYALIPDDGQRHEVVDGVHFVNPSPSFDHQSVSVRLATELVLAIERTGLGRVVTAPMDVELSPHDIVQPDIVVVLSANASIITPSRIQGSPDLLVEILSPSTTRHDRVRKRSAYESAGVPEYWIVDLRERTVEQFVLEEQAYRLVCRHFESVRLHAWPDVVVDLATVWPD